MVRELIPTQRFVCDVLGGCSVSTWNGSGYDSLTWFEQKFFTMLDHLVWSTYNAVAFFGSVPAKASIWHMLGIGFHGIVLGILIILFGHLAQHAVASAPEYLAQTASLVIKCKAAMVSCMIPPARRLRRLGIALRHRLEPIKPLRVPVKPFNPPCLRHEWESDLQPSEYDLVDPANWEGTRAWTGSLGWPVLLILPRPKKGQTGQAAVLLLLWALTLLVSELDIDVLLYRDPSPKLFLAADELFQFGGAHGYGELLDSPLETQRILGALTSSTKLAKHGIALTHSTNLWTHFSAQPNGAIFRLRFDDGFVAANALFHLAMSF